MNRHKHQILEKIKRIDPMAARDAEEIWTPTLHDILGPLVDEIIRLEGHTKPASPRDKRLTISDDEE